MMTSDAPRRDDSEALHVRPPGQPPPTLRDMTAARRVLALRSRGPLALQPVQAPSHPSLLARPHPVRFRFLHMPYLALT